MSSDPITFQAKMPLRASADASFRVTPYSHQAVAVAVNNLDRSAEQQGDLTLNLWTITGTEVLSAAAHVSLGAGASQDYNLAYTAPDEGIYALEVSLHCAGKAEPVVYDPLLVQATPVFLPVVLRNYQ